MTYTNSTDDFMTTYSQTCMTKNDAFLNFYQVENQLMYFIIYQIVHNFLIYIINHDAISFKSVVIPECLQEYNLPPQRVPSRDCRQQFGGCKYDVHRDAAVLLLSPPSTFAVK
jgi:hypothetical protein